jgi:phage host-nuclease inhibitor protein Gam
MSTNDPAFWVLVVVAVSFVVIAVAAVSVAVIAGRAARAVANAERKVEPLVERMHGLAEQVRLIAAQGREVAEQVTVMSGHLATATMHFSESMALVKDEVRELKQIVGISAETARDKVEMISRSIDQTHTQLMVTTDFITSRVIAPAREIAAIMAGVRRGLEVLVAPAPKQIDQSYTEDELFIG